jgi:hypothetical protein
MFISNALGVSLLVAGGRDGVPAAEDVVGMVGPAVLPLPAAQAAATAAAASRVRSWTAVCDPLKISVPGW